jgi:uncharacterized lipoprotein YddW (UPF0748 family)
VAVRADSSVARPVPAAALPDVPREFRGVWVASVANIDWPSRPGLPTAQQQAELVAILDRAVALHLNAVVLQVRPAADALYDSPHEPWSAYLTGEEGRAPSPYYDPLRFAVDEAHRRGLELHAWFNPYRARHPSARGAAARTHVSVRRPELVRSYGTYQWMDPGEPAVMAQTLAVMLDVVRRYDVDGIHIDDYFYPYPVLGPDSVELPFPDSASYARYRRAGGRLARDDWRRHNVDTLVRELYRRTKALKPWVRVGISPFGIWRPGHPPQIQGFDAHQKLYADARRWLREGWLDYLTPQLYWPTAQTAQSYPVLLDWWLGENVRARHLWPGHNASRAAGTLWPEDELPDQVRRSRLAGANGGIHFSMRALMPAADVPRDSTLVGVATPPPAPARAAALADRLRTRVYAEPALVPPSAWLARGRPARPVAELRAGSGGTRVLHLAPGGAAVARWWTVRALADGTWRTWVLPAAQRTLDLGATAPSRVVVEAVDRYGTQSEAAEVAIR